MTTQWKGAISLPPGLPLTSLEGIELSTFTPVVGAQTNGPKASADENIFPRARLHVASVIDAAKVPLWLACGPSFNVQTDNEATAVVLASIFVDDAWNSLNGEDNGADDKGANGPEAVETRQTQKALLVQILYDGVEDLDKERNFITELVFYGVITTNSANDPDDILAGDPETPPTSGPSLTIHALPISSHLLHQTRQLAAVKCEATDSPNPAKATFLQAKDSSLSSAASSVRKRKLDSVLSDLELAQKASLRGNLPPGLRRPWHQRIGSFSNSTGNLTSPVEVESRDGEKGDERGLFTRSTSDVNNLRRSVGPGATLQRERSQSVIYGRMTKELSERPGSAAGGSNMPRPATSRRATAIRTASIRLGSESGSGIGLQRGDSFGGSMMGGKTREASPDISYVKTESTWTSTNGFAERNRAALQKVVLSGLRLAGLTRVKTEDGTEDEYKQVYHQTVKAVTFGLRKSWNEEFINAVQFRRVTEHILKVFVGGVGFTDGESVVKSEEEEENVFLGSKGSTRKAGLFANMSRSESFFADESFLQEDTQIETQQETQLEPQLETQLDTQLDNQLDTQLDTQFETQLEITDSGSD